MLSTISFLGFHGNPVNGGKCTMCNCNNRADDCNRDSGKCYCTTKGIIGDQCEKCDSTNHYHSDPSNNKSCYCEYSIEYLTLIKSYPDIFIEL